MSSNINYENISSIPYSERQLVIVMPDEIVEKQRKADSDSSKNPFDWIEIGKSAASASSLFRLGLVPGLVATAGMTAYEAWKNARANGVNALQVKRSEAHKMIFPPAHPRNNVLYVGHPSDSNVYYTVASFHRVAFEHKFAEAVDLLMHLGAIKIKVEHVRGWSSEFAATLSAPLQNGSGNVTVGSNSGSKSTLLFEASLPENKSRTLPKSLVWYPHEPTWQSIAKGRLSFDLNEFSLTVNYEDDFGINAGLKASAMKAGLDLGGTFENHVATSWKLIGTFAPVG